LILLAFLLPFSVYLLLLGIINRRAHPVLVPGVWDFVGILFAASGFLLVIGPAVISSGSESWRMFWLFGSKGGNPELGDDTIHLWGPLAALYFAVVMGGAIYLLRQRRGITAIYNVDADSFEKALAQVFGVLRLNPLRSGSFFVFNRVALPVTARLEPEPVASATNSPSFGADGGLADGGVPERAVLEIDPFRAMRHVTLRWQPATSRLRNEVENELERVLGRVESTNHAVGDWFVLVSLALLAFNLFATFGLTISSFVRR
jgi:hypothetical protein